MAQGKYAKYISKLQPTGIQHPEYNKKIREPLLFNEASYPGAPIQVVTQLICESGCGWGLGLTLVNPPGLDVKDEPHTHDYDEVWIFIGTNPKDNKELGGEVEFWMGEGDEAEKYIITEPSAVVVPAGVSHCPVYFKNVKRPFFSIPIVVGPHKPPKYTKIPPAFKR
ncbi:MAG: hypothetical protein PVJ81_01390 [Dehalococcoidia bacterium]|jgi:mannose-6-phosphate isomerase-like protein (cupin superfamily)